MPSALDGLKPSQRKVLFACFEKKLLPTAAEIKVGQLAGFVIERTAYHHGEASMHQTIVNMAQDYVGANNVPLLEPCGQFGTRADGGKDAASVRYIFTRLGRLTPLLFPPADLPVLECAEEDGELVEPLHFVPVLPALLLNGSDGIGTGWSTTCHGYHPLEVLEASLACAEGRPMAPMRPWAAGFRGTIELRRGAGRGQPLDVDAPSGALASTPSKFLSRGVAELTTEGVVISELPLGAWTSSYKAWLQRTMAADEASWVSFAERHTERSVCFAFKHTAEQLRALRSAAAPPLHEAFGLEAMHSLTNMHAFDGNGELVHFARPEEIVGLHAQARLGLYGKRKAHGLGVLEAELDGLTVMPIRANHTHELIACGVLEAALDGLTARDGATAHAAPIPACTRCSVHHPSGHHPSEAASCVCVRSAAAGARTLRGDGAAGRAAALRACPAPRDCRGAACGRLCAASGPRATGGAPRAAGRHRGHERRRRRRRRGRRRRRTSPADDGRSRPRRPRRVRAPSGDADRLAHLRARRVPRAASRPGTRGGGRAARHERAADVARGARRAAAAARSVPARALRWRRRRAGGGCARAARRRQRAAQCGGKDGGAMRWERAAAVGEEIQPA